MYSLFVVRSYMLSLCVVSVCLLLLFVGVGLFWCCCLCSFVLLCVDCCCLCLLVGACRYG